MPEDRLQLADEFANRECPYNDGSKHLAAFAFANQAYDPGTNDAPANAHAYATHDTHTNYLATFAFSHFADDTRTYTAPHVSCSNAF